MIKQIIFHFLTTTLILTLAAPVSWSQSDEASEPEFKIEASPRKPDLGLEVSLYGGINFHQNADVDFSIPSLGLSQSYDNDQEIGPVVGLKIGYTGDPLEFIDFPGIDVMPSIEGEFIYSRLDEVELETGNTFGTGVGSRGEVEIDIFAFMINPIIRVQWNNFRPYIGGGVGGAYIDTSLTNLRANNPAFLIVGGGDASDFVVAYQGLLGTDYFINDQWSLFFEYKYLGLLNPSFKSSFSTFEPGNWGNSLANFGARIHF